MQVKRQEADSIPQRACVFQSIERPTRVASQEIRIAEVHLRRACHYKKPSVARHPEGMLEAGSGIVEVSLEQMHDPEAPARVKITVGLLAGGFRDAHGFGGARYPRRELA